MQYYTFVPFTRVVPTVRFVGMKRSYLPITWAGAVAVLLAACMNGSDVQSDPYEESSYSVSSLSGIPDSAWVPVAEAKQMVANYAPRAGYVDRDGQQRPNTRCAWIPLEYLEGMVGRLQNEGADGLRIYFAAYDSVYSKAAPAAMEPPNEWWGYNTVLFVSTRDSVSNGQRFHRDYYTNIATTGRAAPATGGFIVAMEPVNRAGICPPPDKCKDKGALLLEDGE